ncbi:M13 family metallopeptidase [Candidatus Laterigemmans baculatus]|uniref:M13 family metallopeptidase n=1 Tax=Candidatus Laterigemmans baculatus TaxID=2770505 RepID=UPI0013DA6D99|nr:M13 family metallopeptidase [Candidatus Laterigemmans baculatus]
MPRTLRRISFCALLLSATAFGHVAPQPAAAEQPTPDAPGSALSGIEQEYFSEQVAPGDDFYQHVNDGWLRKTEIPGDRSDYGTFTVLSDRTEEQVRSLIEAAAETEAAPGSNTQKVGDFYRSYTDYEARNAAGTAPIQPLLQTIDQIDSREDLGAVLAKLLRSGVGGPFVTYVSPDARSSDQYAVYVYQSGITLPDRDYYLEDEERYQALRTQLGDYASDLLAAIDVEDPQAAAAEVVGLETQLAEAQWTNVQNRDPVKTYNKQSSQEIRETLAALPWKDFADQAGIADQSHFIVRQPTFISRVNELLTDVPLETWKDYLRFRVIDAYAPALTESLERRHFEFHDTALSGIVEQKPLWKRAVEGTGSTLGEVVGKLYVDEHFSPKAKARMEELVENLKKAFAERIEQLEWMGPGTKKQALEKLSMFNTKIGYPDQWKDYSKLEIKADDLAGNLLRSANFEYQREIDKLGGPIDRNEWLMTPQTINAYYNPLMNEIVFPAAILQPPFFNLAADDAVNYGAIGAVIGHEISHGFDDKGSQYDGHGNLRNWWTQEDRQEFEARAQKLVEQYSQYKPFEDMHVNGELTLGENIGDLGGLSVAHRAYQMSLEGKPAPVIEGLSGDQRFLLGWSQIWRRKYREPELRKRLLTDPHSPSRYRVNGIVSNMDVFYDAFNIQPGDEMYIAPENRVRIW